MRNQYHLWPEEKKVQNDLLQLSATLEKSDGTREILWFRLPASYESSVTSSSDPFVVALLFFMMQAKADDLVVHGEVSPSFLRNLEEYQVIWLCWKPETYRPFNVIVEQKQEREATGDRAISTFSGGLDSCFTVWRHCVGDQLGWLKENLQAAVMVHGFDIPLAQEDMFQSAFARSKRITDSVNLELIPLTTNQRSFTENWEDAHGTAVAAGLMLFQPKFSRGLIPSSYPYEVMHLPWGSNPISDHLLSSQAFQIVHDGAAYERLQKVPFIKDWPSAVDNLRVCWSGELTDRNCGKCVKCIRTRLGLYLSGVKNPACFDNEITVQDIFSLNISRDDLSLLTMSLDLAKKANIVESNISEPWIKALQSRVRQQQFKYAADDFLHPLKSLNTLKQSVKKLLVKTQGFR